MNGGRNASGYPDPTATIAIGNVYREQRKEQTMNRSKKATGFLVTRKEYDKIRKYDHSTMDKYMRTIYKSGWEEGVSAGKKSVPGIDLDEIMEAIGGIKGIGEKLKEKIRQELTERLTIDKEESRK